MFGGRIICICILWDILSEKGDVASFISNELRKTWLGVEHQASRKTKIRIVKYAYWEVYKSLKTMIIIRILRWSVMSGPRIKPDAPD